MATTTAPPRDETLTRMDAAHVLLSASSAVLNSRSIYDSKMTTASSSRVPHGFLKSSPSKCSSVSWDEPLNVKSLKSTSQGASSGLDALALLASRASELSSPSVDEDRDMMPPPPPRVRQGRMRSVSNPEGMEKWDSLYQNRSSSRMHFLLPSTILEEELQNANDACEAHEKLMLESEARHGLTDFSLTSRPECNQGDEEYLGTSPHVVVDFPVVIKKGSKRTAKKSWKKLQLEEEDKVSDEDEVTEESSEDDEVNLDPAELLQRARNRLFEDLSLESGLEKGDFVFPHLFDKYKEIYNKNGRIGIYTPAERAAIIARFQSKRNRRVWNKKIRYNCRKNLADRRMRVKGRFVKREVEQSSVTSPTLMPVSEEGKDMDMDMPDVNDPDAGFKPTASQPYKRTRRHTIT